MDCRGSSSDAAFLNDLNKDPSLPTVSDVVVVGGGIHSLIYAIHAKTIALRRLKPRAKESKAVPADATSITVFEKGASPGYKIGESTLTVFGVWLKTIGISSPLLWRLFGPKDGLAFYYLPQNGDPENYTSFTANGPPGDFVPTLQIERKVSELLLTLVAQRLGVKVLHGHQVDINATQLSDNGNVIQVQDLQTSAHAKIKSQLLVDATGRFRRFASKQARVKRFEGWNTDACWAYFEEVDDESRIPLEFYESCNTNHICIPEGWAWVIRLPTWEGSPLPNLVAMIEYLLSLNAQNAEPDAYPSSQALAKKFSCKVRYIVSIGFALRSDIKYPDDLSKFGSCEAERKFNWIASRYPKMSQLMTYHRLIRDPYGPGTTWYIRKQLSYQSPLVTGPGMAAIGDATGFTNPLFSPGINANLGTSVFLAENTQDYLTGAKPAARAAVLQKYENFCAPRITNLVRMNRFNYLCMRSPETGPIGPLWQYLAGTGTEVWQRMRGHDFDTVADVLCNWEWGANQEEYIAFADQIIKLLEGPPTRPDDIVILQAKKLSEAKVNEAVWSGKFKNRWGGLFRWYDDSLVFNAKKNTKDSLAERCTNCRNWRILREDASMCPTCGHDCGKGMPMLWKG